MFFTRNTLRLNILNFTWKNVAKRTTNQLSVRLPRELLTQLEEASRVTGIGEQEIVKALIKAFAEQIADGERPSIPFRLESNVTQKRAPHAESSARSLHSSSTPPQKSLDEPESDYRPREQKPPKAH